MKNYLILLCLLVVGFNADAQKLCKKDIPNAVLQKIQSMYPTATDIDWEREGKNFEAEIDENNQEISLLFNPSGEHLSTEMEIPISSLPAKISEYAQMNLSKKSIKLASKITEHNGSVLYEIELGKEDYIFDADGNYLRKE